MNRHAPNPWPLVPALLLAATLWTGAAHAQGPAPGPPGGEDLEMEFEFDGEDFELDDESGDAEVEEFEWTADAGGHDFRGPGGLSGPAPRHDARMRGDGDGRRVERRILVRRGGRGMAGMHGRMQGRHGMPGGMKGKAGLRGMMRRHHAGMAAGLDLSDRQKEQMADLHEAHQRRMIATRSGLAEARLDLRKLMRAESPDRAKIDATIDRMAKLRADAQKSRVATRLEAQKVLTPEQRKKMKDARGGMGGHGGMRHGHGGEGMRERGGHRQHGSRGDI